MEAFYPKYIDILILEIDNAMKWSNIQIYDINHYSCFHKKIPSLGGAFCGPLVSNTYIPLFKVNFHHTGYPKEWKMQ